MSETLHPFDLATALGDPGKDTRAGRTSDDYWGFVGPFGGQLAATLLRAVMEHPAMLGEPVALTVNFCAPVAKGAFAVTARPARTNRSTQHWTMDLSQGGEPVLTATAVTAVRRETWAHQTAAVPQMPPPDAVQPFAAPNLKWVRQYDFRFVDGAPDLHAGRTEPLDPPASALSRLWLRDAKARTLDYLSLASMADAFFGRLFHVQGIVPPFGTVSMTTYFHAAADEFAHVGSAPIFGIADAKSFNRSYSDQTVELWSADRKLLATSTQIAYFRA